jgi:hypothetical protein
MHHKRFVFLMTLSLLATSAGRASEESAAPDYVGSVAPVLKQYCAGCHNDGDREGDFSVESFASLMQGTPQGPALLAGDAPSSRLIRVLAPDADPHMPPEDEPQPTAEQIALLERWINTGAKGPDGAEPDRMTLIVPRLDPSSRPSPVTALDLSPDGRLLAVGGAGFVHLQSLPQSDSRGDASPETPPLRQLASLPGKVNAVHFVNDGAWLLTAAGVSGLGGVATLWNVADGAIVREFHGHRDTLYDAELAPDGSVLATCSYDQQIILWNAATGAPLRTLTGHTGAVYDVAFSPDSAFLVSASADATCKVWRVSDGLRLDTLNQPLKEQYTCSFLPNGRMIVAAGADNRIRMWRFISREQPRINPLVQARFAHEGAVLRIACSADGRRLVSLAEDQTMKVWRAGNLTELQVWDEQPDVAMGLAVARDGRQFVVGRMDGSLERFAVRPEPESAPASTAEAEAETVARSSAPERSPPAQIAEQEPNNEPGQAQQLTLPAQVRGVILGTADGAAPAGRPALPDADLFRFSARAGEEWVVEVDAERSKSPLDSFVEVLDLAGERLERVVLQAVRDSYFTFRGKDADQANDFRVFNWEEMELNEYLYANGEVVKLWLYPRGPDSGYDVYPGFSKRWGYFDTTPLAHALGEPCYIVRPVPPGSEILPNGLPTFPLYFENDDDSIRELGADSRLFFTAPRDGEYLVRIRDVRGFEGEDYRYALTLRPRRPDFQVSVVNKQLTVDPGSSREFTVRARRQDGFDGPIRIDFAGPGGDADPAAGTFPKGVEVTSPLIIEAGQMEATGLLTAAPDAELPSGRKDVEFPLIARAEIAGQTVTHPAGSLGPVSLGKPAALTIAIVPAAGGAPPLPAPPGGPLEFAIEPGQTIMLRVVASRGDFDGEISFGKELAGRNLPHGVFVDNIGLNGLLLLRDQSEREFFITAASWVPEQSRLFHLTTDAGSGPSSNPVWLHVRPAKE